MKLFCFVGVQILTATMIFTLAILQRSLMSLFYIALCLALFWNMKDFFYLEKMTDSSQWINRVIFKKFLLILCFVDVAFQVVYQIPFMPGQSGAHGRYFGFDKIYRNGDVSGLTNLAPGPGGKYASYIEMQNLFFFMVKALNFFFIIMQSRVYESEGFQKFMRVDMRQIMSMANNYKSSIIKYVYNNKKLEDIIKSQQKTKLCYKNLDTLVEMVIDF